MISASLTLRILSMQEKKYHMKYFVPNCDSMYIEYSDYEDKE